MRFPRLTKRGYAVRLPTGEYRGVYRDGRYYTLLYARVAETERLCSTPLCAKWTIAASSMEASRGSRDRWRKTPKRLPRSPSIRMPRRSSQGTPEDGCRLPGHHTRP
jgi:hypothetical protein